MSDEGRRYNASVQFPSLVDYRKVKTLAVKKNIPIGTLIVQLVEKEAEALGVSLADLEEHAGKARSA